LINGISIIKVMG